uniref:Uncharacterized protein n=1 Tax=Arundo donax TaxID=35708 RepID=A0A0A9G3K3_ARUDO
MLEKIIFQFIVQHLKLSIRKITSLFCTSLSPIFLLL